MDNSKKEHDKYYKMWERPEYRERSPGLRFLGDALTRMQMPEGSTVLDIGCGTGRVSKALHDTGFVVTALDIAENACDEFPGEFICSSIWELKEGKWQYGFCADMMEHIPTVEVDKTLEAISKHVGVCYFQIANFHCHMGKVIGETLHLTVEKFNWWEEKMNQYFSILESSEEPKHHIFVCKSLQY